MASNFLRRRRNLREGFERTPPMLGQQQQRPVGTRGGLRKPMKPTPYRAKPLVLPSPTGGADLESIADRLRNDPEYADFGALETPVNPSTPGIDTTVAGTQAPPPLTGGAVPSGVVGQPPTLPKQEEKPEPRPGFGDYLENPMTAFGLNLLSYDDPGSGIISGLQMAHKLNAQKRVREEQKRQQQMAQDRYTGFVEQLKSDPSLTENQRNTANTLYINDPDKGMSYLSDIKKSGRDYLKESTLDRESSGRTQANWAEQQHITANYNDLDFRRGQQPHLSLTQHTWDYIRDTGTKPIWAPANFEDTYNQEQSAVLGPESLTDEHINWLNEHQEKNPDITESEMSWRFYKKFGRWPQGTSKDLYTLQSYPQERAHLNQVFGKPEGRDAFMDTIDLNIEANNILTELMELSPHVETGIFSGNIITGWIRRGPGGDVDLEYAQHLLSRLVQNETAYQRIARGAGSRSADTDADMGRIANAIGSTTMDEKTLAKAFDDHSNRVKSRLTENKEKGYAGVRFGYFDGNKLDRKFGGLKTLGSREQRAAQSEEKRGSAAETVLKTRDPLKKATPTTSTESNFLREQPSPTTSTDFVNLNRFNAL